jgi:hypothetical protein
MNKIKAIKRKYMFMFFLLLVAVGATIFFLTVLTNIFVLPQIDGEGEASVIAMVIFAGIFGVLAGFAAKSLYVINLETLFFRGTFLIDRDDVVTSVNEDQIFQRVHSLTKAGNNKNNK